MESTIYHEEYNELELVDILRILWKGKKLIAGFILGSIILTVLYLNFFAVYLFETEATIQLTNTTGLYSNADYISHLLQSEAYINPVMQELDLVMEDSDNYQNIRKKIEIKKIEKANIIQINIKDHNPELAYQINQKIINRYQEESNQSYQAFIHDQNDYLEYLKRELIDIENKIIMLEEQIQHVLVQDNQTNNIFYLSGMTEQLDSYYQTKRIFQESKLNLIIELKSYYPAKILDMPYLPDTPVSPNKKLFLLVAAFLGFFCGVFFAFLLDYLQKHKEEIINQDTDREALKYSQA